MGAGGGVLTVPDRPDVVAARAEALRLAKLSLGEYVARHRARHALVDVVDSLSRERGDRLDHLADRLRAIADDLDATPCPRRGEWSVAA